MTALDREELRGTALTSELSPLSILIPLMVAAFPFAVRDPYTNALVLGMFEQWSKYSELEKNRQLTRFFMLFDPGYVYPLD